MIGFHYKCHTCGKTYQRDEVRYLCPECSPNELPEIPLKGVLECVLNYETINQSWNQQQADLDIFSPVDKKYYPRIQVGNTPFFKVERLGDKLCLNNLWIKNDGASLSGSLKDRASFLVVAEANRLGLDTVITASTGNAACALSAICAADCKKAIIFVPKTAPKAKLTQLRLYGADLRIVDGSYDDAYRESLLYSIHNQGLNRNTAYHPLTIEGKKTVALEIFKQNNFKAPDSVIVPVGDGVIIAGVYKGFYDLFKAGLIEKIPKLISIQAEKSSAINNLYNTKLYQASKDPSTIADSISVRNPGNAYMAVDCIKNSEGFCVNVNDNEIMEAQKYLSENSGVYAEPAASASLAGLIKAKDRFYKDEQIVLLITGNGLKDIDASIRFMEKDRL